LLNLTESENEMTARPITRYDAEGGLRIYRIPVQAFPALIVHIHVVIAGDYAALIDTGSGLGESSQHLESGMAALRKQWGERLDWPDIKRIVITHGHVDHYGGLGYVRARTDAPIAVHELDRRVLTNFEERRVLSSHALAAFLRRAGVSDAAHAELMRMYSWSKGLFQSVAVETVLHDGDLLDGVFTVHHAPGHCPGQVCLQLGSVLLSADHVLPRTSPHIAPESLSASTGLDHYIQALHKIAHVSGVDMALGGHEEPIGDLYGRVAEIETSHHNKLNYILDLCHAPRTISELSKAFYGTLRDYHILLALEEIGAHVEYLDQRGELAIANLDDVAADETVAPRYHRV
jgi:glyoxylase-like metal-dependent hydrolase (beta-lactamase superfamily II)